MLSIKPNLLILLFMTTVSAAFASTGSVSYEKIHRINDHHGDDPISDWFAASVDKSFKLGSMAQANLDIDGRFYVEASGEYDMSIKEANIKVDAFTYGFQTFDWNPHESYWLLNNLDGRRGFTLLDEKKAGNLGVGYTGKPHKMVQVDLFASYFYVPSLSPKMRVENGEVVTQSEWSKRPPTSVKSNLTGEDVPLYYIVVDDSKKDIILNKSLGGRIKVGDKKDFYGSASVYAIYKPENTLRYNIEGGYNPEPNTLEVLIKPIVNHHVIYGLQYEKQVDRAISLSAGIDVTDPNANLGNDFEVLDPLDFQEMQKSFPRQYGETISYAPNYDRESYFYTNATYAQNIYQLSFNYAHLLSENVRTGDDFFSESRKWVRTVGFNGRYFFSDAFSTELDYKFDLSRFDEVLNANATYLISNQYSLGLGVEMVKAPESTSYWSAYRTKDSVYTTFNFIF